MQHSALNGANLTGLSTALTDIGGNCPGSPLRPYTAAARPVHISVQRSHAGWLIPAPLQQLTFSLIVDPSSTRRSRGIGNLIQANPFISVAILDVILETIARCNGAMFHLGLGWIGTCRRIRPYCAQGAAGGACNGSAGVGFKSSEAQVQDSS